MAFQLIQRIGGSQLKTATNVNSSIVRGLASKAVNFYKETSILSNLCLLVNELHNFDLVLSK